MKISELKKYIKEAILAELTVTSDPKIATDLAKRGENYRFDPKVTQEAEDKDNLAEMAKIAGDLKTAIEAVIKKNPGLEGLDLRKAIKSDSAVKTALGGESLHDNQLNQFIKLVRGDRELGQRGRKPNSDTATKKSEEDKKEGERRGRKPKSEDEDVDIEDTYGKLDPEDTSDDDKEPSQVKDDPFIKREKGQIATIQATLKANAGKTMEYIKTPENKRTPEQKAHLKKMADLTKKLRKLKNPTLQSLIGDED